MIDPRQPDYTRTPAHQSRADFTYAPTELPRPTDPNQPTHPRTPAVSIMTPYYNTGHIFHETATSILRQSFQDWEWIIVNDGSTDPTARAVLDDYRTRDPRIRVLDLPENRGLSAARNAGYHAARADIVMQIDSDDLVEPTFLEKCLWFLRTNPQWGFVCGWTVGFGHDSYLWGQGFHNLDRFLHENLVTPTALVRKHVWADAGGYDEANRKGLEDWDFWLRCASAGHWGTSIPEFLDWYRRRPNHNSSWGNWDRGPNQERFSAQLREKYADLYDAGLPKPKPNWPQAMAPLPAHPPLANPLAKHKPRLLMIVPWLRFGGADKFNLDLIQQLTTNGWEVSVAATLDGDQSWLPHYTRLTPDVFALERFVRPYDRPLFLRYLIDSRRPDAVMVTNSELGYHLLPYLRAHCPTPAYLDLTHIEEETWKSGGYPRYSAASQDLLDLNIVVSEHLKTWLITRGADPDRVEVCHINVDPEAWAPDPAARAAVRAEHDIPDNAVVLLYPARLCPQKQPRVLAKALALLAERSTTQQTPQPSTEGAGRSSPANPTPPFIALIVGDGEDRPWLEAFIAQHKLTAHVRLLGAQPPEAMPALYHASDILFLPSRWEGIALSIYEAMAASLCVVGADVGGQKELVTPDTGLLLPVADQPEDDQARAYADALRTLLADPARRRSLARAARERIERHFTLDAMGRRMLDLIASAQRLHAQRPRPPFPRRFADELAVRAIDYFRLQRLCERTARAAQAASPAPHAPLAAPTNRRPRASAKPHAKRPQRRRRSASAAELKIIENSRAWRLIQAARRSFLYAIYARLRHGRSWRASADAVASLPPRQRLQVVKSSTAYRLLRSLKSSPLYRLLRRPVALDTTRP